MDLAITSHVNQSILTVSTANTLVCSAPSTPTWYADGVSIGTGTPVGNGLYSLSWTPNSTDFDVDITVAAGAQTSAPIKIAIAEANHVSALTAWSLSGVTRTTGFADPDGGTGAVRILSNASATAVAHMLSRLASPANTVLEPAYEIWAKAGTASKLLFYWAEDGSKHYSYIDLATGYARGQWQSAKIVERRVDGWCRIWVQSRGGAVTQSTMRIYILNDWSAPNQIMAGTEDIYLYAPRVVDGFLPFTDYQLATPSYVGVVNNLHRWAVRTPYVDSVANMVTDRYIDVLLPDSYNPANTYSVIYVGEVKATPNVLADGLQTFRSLNIHNDYNVIVARTLYAGIPPWYGAHQDGNKKYDVQIKDVLVGLVDEFYSTRREREGRFYVGFSKSGFGAFSAILRNPDVFGYAAAWDVPWNLSYGDFGTEHQVNFGSSAQFDLYNPIGLLPTRAASVNDKTRLVVSGAYTFASHVTPMTNALDANNIPYSYVNAPTGGHNWDTGWLPSVIAAMMALRP